MRQRLVEGTQNRRGKVQKISDPRKPRVPVGNGLAPLIRCVSQFDESKVLRGLRVFRLEK